MKAADHKVAGRSILRAAERLLSQRALETVVRPALADLQHEAALARDSGWWRRAAVRLRGYAAFGRAVAVWCASWPARSLREDWLRAGAPGPRLAAALAPRVLWLGVLVTSAMTALVDRSSWDPAILVLSLPASLPVTLPLAFVLALVMALGRLGKAAPSAPRAWLGAAAGLSLVPSVAVFVLVAWITPTANQAWRERIFRKAIAEEAGTGGYRIAPGEPFPLAKGSRELTLGELEDRIASARAADSDRVKWHIEWHKKWALGATCLALAPLAVGLHACLARRRVAWAFLYAGAVDILQLIVLWTAERAALRGALRPGPRCGQAT